MTFNTHLTALLVLTVMVAYVHSQGYQRIRRYPNGLPMRYPNPYLPEYPDRLLYMYGKRYADRPRAEDREVKNFDDDVDDEEESEDSEETTEEDKDEDKGEDKDEDKGENSGDGHKKEKEEVDISGAQNIVVKDNKTPETEVTESDVTGAEKGITKKGRPMSREKPKETDSEVHERKAETESHDTSDQKETTRKRRPVVTDEVTTTTTGPTTSSTSSTRNRGVK